MLCDAKKVKVSKKKTAKLVSIVTVIAMTFSLLLSGCGEDTSKESKKEKKPAHVYTTSIAKGASSAHLKLQADAKLKDKLEADAVILSGALKGFEVKKIKRVDDTTVSINVVLPKGSKQSGKEFAVVSLTQKAFAEKHDDPYGEGSTEKDTDIAQNIGLSMEEPGATILPLKGKYDSKNNMFVLPVSLGCAEFVKTPKAKDFRISDGSFSVKEVDYDGKSLTKATLNIEVPEKMKARIAFDKLDKTLSEDGIQLAAGAANCGSLVIGSKEMREAEREGYRVTALSCLESQPQAFVKDTDAVKSKIQDDDGKTDYDVKFKTTIKADPGTVNLPEKDLEAAVKVDPLKGKDQVLKEEVKYIGKNSLYLHLYLPSKVIDALSSDDGEAAVDDAQNDVVRFVRAHKLVLGEGVITNKWGISQPAADVPIHITKKIYDEESKEDSSEESGRFVLIDEAYGANSEESNDGDDQSKNDDKKNIDPEKERRSFAQSEATKVSEKSEPPKDDKNSEYGTADLSAYNLADENEDLEEAKKAFDAMSKIFETAGAFAAGDPEGIITGISGIFGFVSMALGYGDGDLLSLKDIMDKLNDMQEVLNSIDAKIDQLSTQLADVEKKLSYHDDLNKLRDTITYTEMLGSTLKKDLWDKKIDWDKETGGIKNLSEDKKKAIEKFLDDADGLLSTYGRKVARDTLDLGNLIIGDPSLCAKSVIQEFNECVDTMFNWEPEAYLYRMIFMTRLEYAYMCGYTTAVTQLQYEAYKSGNPEKYEEAMKVLLDNFKKVQETIQGKVTYEKGEKTKIEESKYVAATHARSDGNIKNNVTGTLFGSDSEQLIYLGGLTKYCNKCSEPDGITTYKFNGAISRGNFETMVGRLSNVKYKTLWEEMVAMTGSDRAFVTSDWSAGFNKHATWTHSGFMIYEVIKAAEVCDGDKAAKDYYGRILVSKSEMECLHNRPSIQHTYHWTASYFDLNKNTVCTSAEIYLADQKYSTGDMQWNMNISLYPYFNMVRK